MSEEKFWKFKKSNNTLVCTEPDAFEYYVDLDDCNNSAEILDWIIQISKKRWCNSEVLASLIHTLDDIINIQQNICPFGRDKNK